MDYLVEETDGGLDFTFDATGNVSGSVKRGFEIVLEWNDDGGGGA